jgi:DNA-binding XRE family transcriptional regulator
MRDALRYLRDRRVRAEGELDNIHTEFARIIPTAISSGLSKVEIAQLAGVSRKTLYRAIDT